MNKNGKEAVWMEEQYKLISTEDEDFLFDIINDEEEKNNLTIEMPERTSKMKEELLLWKKSVYTDWNTIEK